ncbi:hypothetical protein BC829DRAFT_403657, partial [Chytridium lagenaria]
QADGLRPSVPTALSPLPNDSVVSPSTCVPHRSIFPTFMHGKSIGTSERLTEKGGNRIKTVVFPNILYHFAYSRVLNMNGGFDEYLLSIGEGKCDNEPAKMYKRLVEEAYAKQRDQIRSEELNLASKHGQDYVNQISQFHKRLDRFKKGSVSRI